MSVSDLITAAFAEAWRTHGAAHEAWIRVSYRLGGLMPDSLLPMSIQQADSLDVHPHQNITCWEFEIESLGYGAEAPTNSLGYCVSAS